MALYDGNGNLINVVGTSATISAVNIPNGGHGFEDIWATASALTPKWDGAFCIHRGWNTAPNNTLQAIWETKKNGINMVELDLRRTSDGQYVLSHNPTITGTVDGVETTYTIADETIETLNGLCIGSTAFPNAMVPSLEDAMIFCRRIGMRIDLDFKDTDEQAYSDVLSLAMKYGMQDDVLFTCYSVENAQTVKTAYPHANIRIDIELVKSDTTLDAYCINNLGNVYFFLSGAMCGKTDGSNVSGVVTYENDIPALKQRGYKMYIWNVGSGQIADCIQWEPDILQLVSGHEQKYDFVSLIQDNTVSSFTDVVW